MANGLTRRQVAGGLAAASSGVAWWSFSSTAGAQGKEIILGIPLDSSNSLPFLVAETAGYFKEEGINSRVTTGAAGTNVRNMIAAGQMPYSIGDVIHPLYLSGAGKPAKILMAIDARASVNLVVRNDHWEKGIRTVEDLGKIQKPGGAKVQIGTTRPGSQSWVYGSHLCKMAGIADKVNFVATGDSNTMVGTFKTGQVDAVTAFALVYFAIMDQKLGHPLFDATDSKQWNKYFGSNFPGVCVFGLASQIEADPKLTQSVINATYRALLHIRRTEAPKLAELVQTRFMQGFRRDVAIREISFLKPLFDQDGSFTEAAFQNGGKIWFGDVTKVKAQKYQDLTDFRFLKNAQAKYKA